MIEQIGGFSIPFRIDPATGGVARQTGDEKLKENIVHILMTRLGERVMRRAYGAGVYDMVHDPNNDALMALAQHQIASAIAQWEPRVLLLGLDVEQDMSTMVIRIRYLVRRTNQTESLSLPIGVL